jgi:pSer/pThr/pTyr-binding forkhead associated (FHA) protein
MKPGQKLRVASSIVDWETAFQKQHSAKTATAINEQPQAAIVKTITIGSSNDSNLVVNSRFVSLQHAKISLLKNGSYWLQDMNSRNGSFVNGERVEAKHFAKTDSIKIANSNLPEKWFELFSSSHQRSQNGVKMFALPVMGGMSFVEMEQIIYCEGASNQTRIYLAGNKKELVSRTLKECEEMLTGLNFFRIHKSYLINLNYIKKYISGKDGQVTLTNGITLTVSRNYKNDFLQRFGNR